MKRGGPLRRRTPLARSRLNRVPSRRGARDGMAQAIYEANRRRAFARDGWRCMVTVPHECTGRAEHAHHMRLRSQGGSDDVDNLLSVCHRGHTWIHHHPKLAAQHGWIRRRGSTHSGTE